MLQAEYNARVHALATVIAVINSKKEADQSKSQLTAKGSRLKVFMSEIGTSKRPMDKV